MEVAAVDGAGNTMEVAGMEVMEVPEQEVAAMEVTVMEVAELGRWWSRRCRAGGGAGGGP